VFRILAEHRLGKILVPLVTRHRPKSVDAQDTFRLADHDISRDLSARAQKIAEIPKHLIEDFFKEADDKNEEITTKLLLRWYRHQQTATENQERIVGGRISDLIEFARAGNRCGTVYADPPWHTPGSNTRPYCTISLDELRSLPIPDLAAKRCHLHMWVMSGSHLIAAAEIIEAWGFRVVSSFAWVRPQIGRGNYWRMSHDLMLTAVNSDADRFDDQSLPSWIEAPRGRHSEKPDDVREMIERASPGPRIELFARKECPGWFAWGHEFPGSVVDGEIATTS
jgi:N6-adenosine-specific RNA methylase IME4